MSSTLKKINCIQQIRLCAYIDVMVSKISLIEKYYSALKASASAGLVVSAGAALVVNTMPALPFGVLPATRQRLKSAGSAGAVLRRL